MNLDVFFGEELYPNGTWPHSPSKLTKQTAACSNSKNRAHKNVQKPSKCWAGAAQPESGKHTKADFTNRRLPFGGNMNNGHGFVEYSHTVGVIMTVNQIKILWMQNNAMTRIYVCVCVFICVPTMHETRDVAHLCSAHHFAYWCGRNSMIRNRRNVSWASVQKHPQTKYDATKKRKKLNIKLPIQFVQIHDYLLFRTLFVSRKSIAINAGSLANFKIGHDQNTRIDPKYLVSKFMGFPICFSLLKYIYLKTKYHNMLRPI